MFDPRRIVAVLVGLIGLAVLGVSIWLGALVGTEGRVVFTAHADQTVVIGPDSLNRVSGPVTVAAQSDSGAVWLGAARPSDLATALADGKHQQVGRLDFPSRNVDLDVIGTAVLPDLSTLDIWRSSAESTLQVTQDEAPEAVVVMPRASGDLTITLTYVSKAWFVEAIVFAIVGLIITAFAAGWLHQLSAPPKLSRRGHRASRAELEAAQAEPETVGPSSAAAEPVSQAESVPEAEAVSQAESVPQAEAVPPAEAAHPTQATRTTEPDHGAHRGRSGRSARGRRRWEDDEDE